MVGERKAGVSRHGGKYAALAGPDEGLHGILFAYHGKPSEA